MGLPEEAAAELYRCVSSLGFVGALVDNHLANETFYDDTKFDPVWEAAQDLDVPIYLHPTYPLIEDVNGTTGRFKPEGNNWSQSVAAILGTNAYGWHSDCGMQFIRLWLGGVFDRFPGLKIVLGHMGETVPFMLERTNMTIGTSKPTGVTILEAWANNVWVTTSGFFTLSPFAALLGTTALDRIMVSSLSFFSHENLSNVNCQFSVDYPWSSMEDGAAFMQTLKKSGMVSPSEWEAIAFGNSESLLRLN
jgi:predicted TIM-barrel fold metal-dependent hydrolase